MTQQELIKIPLIERLRAKGIDVRGFERVKQHSKNPIQIPLDDAACAALSIYVIWLDGSLWTVHHNRPYKQVRPATKNMSREVFVCVRCRAQSYSFEGIKHR